MTDAKTKTGTVPIIAERKPGTVPVFSTLLASVLVLCGCTAPDSGLQLDTEIRHVIVTAQVTRDVLGLGRPIGRLLALTVPDYRQARRHEVRHEGPSKVAGRSGDDRHTLFSHG